MLDYTIQRDIPIENHNEAYMWFHPRAAAIPGGGKDSNPRVVMTLQKAFYNTASDFYGGLFSLITDDLGGTWEGPIEEPALAWRELPNGVVTSLADMTPGWHAPTGKLLNIGVETQYENNRMLGPPYPFNVGYAVYDPKAGAWAPWRRMEIPDGPPFHGQARCGCSQWLVLDNGDLLVPLYYHDEGREGALHTAATVARCTFDGETLAYKEHGTSLRIDVPRGIGEPSLTRFGDHFFLTLRNDKGAYVARSGNGLDIEPMKPWKFDDGEPLGSYNTQQHWVTHEEGLFLSYTRRGADNDHVFRHRAPLFIARVDPERLVVLRETERVAIPERGASLGNFGAAAITPREHWVTAAERMGGDAAAHGATGAVFVARVQWNRENGLLGRTN